MRTVRLAGLLAAGLVLTAFMQAGPIAVSETRVENSYPEQIAFEVDISSGAVLSRVELHVTVRGDTSTNVIVADYLPGAVATARAEWKTRREAIPPGASYDYHWEIRDEAGASLTTASESGLVLDSRRDWSALMDDRVAVWWYEGGTAFGQRVFDLAAGSLSYLERESGLTIPRQLHVVLYPDAVSFAEWHDYVQDWVGGEAYPAYSLTVQIVSPDDDWGWVQRVLCHEVAHLYFFQATYNALGAGPATWIDEGYAQYHECIDNDPLGRAVEEARRRGELIPLRLATGSFSGEEERILLLYAESWSAVTFLHDRWGAAGMSRLMEAFHDGADSNDALRAATGLDFEEFQRAWWEWLGGEPGRYPTPPPTAGAGPSAGIEATNTLAAVTTLPAPPQASPTAPAGRGGWPCPGGAAALLAGLITFSAGKGAGAGRSRGPR